jgi:hypothetical protein
MPRTSRTAGGQFPHAQKGRRDADPSRERDVDACGAIHMGFGMPEEVGLRCPYHGWLFDGTGRCLEQPPAPPTGTFKDRVRTTAYQVQEMGGLI